MMNRSIWRMIRQHDFDLKKVARELYELGATSYDVGMAVMITDNQRADLIQYLEDLQDE